MRKEEKNIDKVMKASMILCVLCIFLLFDNRIHQCLGWVIIEVCCRCIITFSIIITICKVIKWLSEIYDEMFCQDAERVWKDIKESVRNKILFYIKKNENNMSISIALELMTIYSDDESILNRLLDIIIKLYNESNPATRSVLAYYLLENINLNEVAAMFEKNIILRGECEEISKQNRDFLSEDFDSIQNELKIDEIEKFFLQVLHSCLPNNSISKEKIIGILQFLTGWILENISRDNIFSYKESVSVFVLMLAEANNKLDKANIYNKDITENIIDIEKSDWFKDLLNLSYSYIRNVLYESEFTLIGDEKWIVYSCLVSTYYEKINIWKRKQLLDNIKVKRLKLRRQYDVEKAVSFLILASPIRMFEKEGDLKDKSISLAYFCMEQLIQFR